MALQALLASQIFLAVSGVGSALPQTVRDYPLVHKDASEFTVGYTEHGMRGGPTLLSEAAFRYGIVLTDPMGKGAFRGNLEYTVDWLPAIVLTKPKVVYGAGVAPHSVCDGTCRATRDCILTANSCWAECSAPATSLPETPCAPPLESPRALLLCSLMDAAFFLAWLVCPLTTHH